MSDSLTCRERQLQLSDVGGSTGTYCRNADAFPAVLFCDFGSGVLTSTSLVIKKCLLTTEYRIGQC
jgi:hypothetical protein